MTPCRAPSTLRTPPLFQSLSQCAPPSFLHYHHGPNALTPTPSFLDISIVVPMPQPHLQSPALDDFSPSPNIHRDDLMLSTMSSPLHENPILLGTDLKLYTSRLLSHLTSFHCCTTVPCAPRNRNFLCSADVNIDLSQLFRVHGGPPVKFGRKFRKEPHLSDPETSQRAW